MVSLRESALRVSQENSGSLVAGTDNSARMRLTTFTILPTANSSIVGYELRRGRSDVVVPIVYDPPGIVESDSPTVLLRSGDFASFFNVRPLAAGSTEVRAGAVPPFQTLPTDVTFRVEPLRLGASLNAPSPSTSRYILTQRLLTLGQLYLNGQPSQPLAIRVESLNPQLVKVMVGSGDTPGDAIVLPGYLPNNPSRFYVMALGSAGEAQIRISGPGLDPIILTLTLGPIILSLEPRNTSQFTNRGPVEFAVSLGSNGAVLPAGFGVRLTITSSNPEIAEVQTGTLVLRDNLSAKFNVTPKRAGIATIRVTEDGGSTVTTTFQVLEPTVGLDSSAVIYMGHYSQKSLRLNFTGVTPV